MKRLLAITLLLSFAECITAQTYNEWFRQDATQKKYLLQQIAALRVYTNHLSKGFTVVRNGLNTIQRIKHGDFNLHKDYLTSLIKVNPKLKRYSKVPDIIILQLSIARQAGNIIKACRHQLTNQEIDYLQKVLNSLLNDSAVCLDKLFNLVSNDHLSMQDDERLAAIDKLYDEMLDKQVFIRSFSNTAVGLSLQRVNDHKDVIISKKINEVK